MPEVLVRVPRGAEDESAEEGAEGGEEVIGSATCSECRKVVQIGLAGALMPHESFQEDVSQGVPIPVWRTCPGSGKLVACAVAQERTLP